MPRLRSARWWASLLTLLALLVTTGAPGARALRSDVYLGEICSAAAAAVVGDAGETAPAGHTGDGPASPHCGACPAGLAALLDLSSSARDFTPAVCGSVAIRIAEARGHGGPPPWSDSPPRAPPFPSVA